MNLLYTLTSYPPATGGAQIHQHELARRLGSRHRVQVAAQWDVNRTDWLLGSTLAAPAVDCDYIIDGVAVRRFGLPLATKAFMAPFVPPYYPLMLLGCAPVAPLARLLERRLEPLLDGADLVHNVRIGREALSWASLRAARRRSIPFVLTPVHHPRWQGRRYRSFIDLYRQADALLALTRAEQDILVRLGADERRVHVIGHGPVLAAGADAQRFRSRHGLSGPLVLFLGQHYDYKGFRQLLQAAPLVWPQVPEARFVFAGPAVGGSEAFFRGTDSRVLRLGPVGLQEKCDALAACSLLCVPSTQESFGGVYAEAWSYARPVIGCPIPAVAELIENGADGFLVPQEPPAIAARIVDLLRDEALARRLGEAGRRKVDAHFSWERIAARVEEVYRGL
jgi:glycosyltransferase involved in cell wall biosynthesis